MNARTVTLGTLALLAAGLSGCASSASVEGTWTGRDADANTPFNFGSVSFVGDKTFTAEAKYGGNTRVQSGTWEARGNDLKLKSGDTTRDYTYKVENDALIVTDPKSGRSLTLTRFKK